MLLELICLNREEYFECKNYWQKIKDILKKYDETCCFDEHIYTCSIEVVNKALHTHIDKLPVVIIYYHDNIYQIFDSSIHTMHVLKSEDDIKDILKACHNYYESKIKNEINELLKSKLKNLDYHIEI